MKYFMDSFAIDDQGTYHGVYPCNMLEPGDTFKCPNCERFVCFCGGHDNYHDESGDVCPLCDECCPRGADETATQIVTFHRGLRQLQYRLRG